MKYKSGDIIQHKVLGDKAVIVMVPIALPMKDESPNIHPEDHIDVNDENWHLIDN